MSDKKIFNGGESGTLAIFLSFFLPFIGSFYTRGISFGALLFAILHLSSALWLFIPVIGWIIAFICHLFFVVMNYNRVTKNYLHYKIQKQQINFG